MSSREPATRELERTFLYQNAVPLVKITFDAEAQSCRGSQRKCQERFA